MTRTLSLAFWNVQNLFEVGGHDTRAPRSERELSAKLDVLARVIQRLTDRGAPDILALAEVSSEAILKRLVAKLGVQVMRPRLLFDPPKKGDRAKSTASSSAPLRSGSRITCFERSSLPKAIPWCSTCSPKQTTPAPPPARSSRRWSSTRGNPTCNDSSPPSAGCWPLCPNNRRRPAAESPRGDRNAAPTSRPNAAPRALNDHPKSSRKSRSKCMLTSSRTPAKGSSRSPKPSRSRRRS